MHTYILYTDAENLSGYGLHPFCNSYIYLTPVERGQTDLHYSTQGFHSKKSLEFFERQVKLSWFSERKENRPNRQGVNVVKALWGNFCQTRVYSKANKTLLSRSNTQNAIYAKWHCDVGKLSGTVWVLLSQSKNFESM